MTNENTIQDNRVAYLDYLRVFATLAVVLLHVSARNWDTTDVMSTQWGALNVYNGLSRWCVPIFVMISGALFLPRELDTKTIYKKYIGRLALVYVFWSLVYMGAILVAYLATSGGFELTWSMVLYEGIKGSYHMWYIPMQIGLYMSIPLLKPMVQNPKTAKYFLLLALVFKSVLPLIYNLLWSFGPESLFQIVKGFSVLTNYFYMDIVLGFAGFYVAGYVLRQTQVTPRTGKIIYALGVLGVVVTILLNALDCRRSNLAQETYLYCFNINVVVTVVAIFVWFQNHMNTERKCYGLIKKLSKYSLGVYLVHPFLLIMLEMVGLNTMSFHPMLSVPVIWAIVTAISFGLSAVMNRIPVVNRYLV